MSRIGKKPITLPKGVEVKVDDSLVTVKGPKGTLTQSYDTAALEISKSESLVKVNRASDEPHHRALHGLTRSLVANMVSGVSEGFSRSLELVGVGYRVQQNGKGITLNVMLSHTVDIDPLPNAALAVEGNNRITVSGIDKQAVGHLAAQIRKVRPPNVYTGKGIRYSGEQIRLKPGKSARRA